MWHALLLCPPSPTHHIIKPFLSLANLTGDKRYLGAVFICICLIMRADEHLLICFRAICISFSVSSDYLNMMSRWKFFFFLDGSLSKPLSVCLSAILLPVPLCVPITGLELVGGVGQDTTIPELGAVATPSAGWSSGLHTWPYLAHTWPGPVPASVLLCSCELGLEGQGQRCLPQGKGPQWFLNALN